MSHKPLDTITRDRERQIALIELLGLPDPVDLPHRGYKYTQTRPANRGSEIVKRDLGTAYVQHARHSFGADISAVVSFRRQGIRRLRRVV